MSQLSRILSEPAWQGLGAIIALTGILMTLRWDFLRSRRRPPPPVEQRAEYFDLTDETQEREYYKKLAASIRNAKETVYRVGRGFHHERNSPIYRALLQAEEAALVNNVEIVRIQVGGVVAASWAEGYARLLEKYPEQFRMVADFEYTGHSDIAVVDPRGRNPLVNLLFESREPGRFGPVGRAKIGFIVRDTNAAGDLHHLLVEQARKSQALTPQGIRDLSRTYVYFGWGVHMASRKMAQDAPGSQRLGVAILRRWERNITAMIDRPADRTTIVETGDADDWFDGVAYEMSWWEKERLTRLERRAYEEVPVTIEINGRPVDAFTFVPLPSAASRRELQSGSWIDLVKEGALENDMVRLLTDLRQAGVPFDPPPPAPL
ncbi:hypothetical protein AB0K00_17415 [Dactylosporangium sp. NPDC049525]|uniref:hypothetical protein n=1 Tax=Dactylosporangium sp. NPDC049525 TaxID=3154730 RepID=UPI003437CB4C